MKSKLAGYFRLSSISIIILTSFFALVPILRCRWFFDSYLIKFWIVQIGTAIVLILYCYRPPIPEAGNLNRTVKYLLLAYLAVNIISLSIVPYPYRYVALPALIAVVTYILMCFLVSQYIRKADLAVVLWIAVTVWAALLGIYQHYKGQRVISTLGNENFLASHIALTIPVTIGYFWRYLKAPKNVLSFCPVGIRQVLLLGLGIGILLIFGTVLYFAHSRGAWLGISVGLVSFGIIAGVPRGKRMVVAVVIVLVVVALLNLPYAIEFIVKQFAGDVRPAIWEGSLGMVTMKPCLGWGKGAYFIFYPQFRITDYWLTRGPTDLTIHAHNEFLQIWAETGTIGLIVFLGLIIAILRIGVKKLDGWSDYSQRYLMLGLVCGVICLLTHNLVCNNLQLHSSAIFLWLVLGLILGTGTPEFKGKLRGPLRPLLLLALISIIVIIMWWICIKPVVSQYFFKQGWKCRSDDNWSLAIQKYKKAIDWDPWNVEMHYRMAYAYTKTGQMDKAIKKYNDVCRMAPDYGHAHRNMGIIYMERGEYKLAKRNFLKALQINPYDMITLHNLTVLKETHDK